MGPGFTPSGHSHHAGPSHPSAQSHHGPGSPSGHSHHAGPLTLRPSLTMGPGFTLRAILTSWPVSPFGPVSHGVRFHPSGHSHHAGPSHPSARSHHGVPVSPFGPSHHAGPSHPSARLTMGSVFTLRAILTTLARLTLRPGLTMGPVHPSAVLTPGRSRPSDPSPHPIRSRPWGRSRGRPNFTFWSNCSNFTWGSGQSNRPAGPTGPATQVHQLRRWLPEVRWPPRAHCACSSNGAICTGAPVAPCAPVHSRRALRSGHIPSLRWLPWVLRTNRTRRTHRTAIPCTP